MLESRMRCATCRREREDVASPFFKCADCLKQAQVNETKEVIDGLHAAMADARKLVGLLSESREQMLRVRDLLKPYVRDGEAVDDCVQRLLEERVKLVSLIRDPYDA